MPFDPASGAYVDTRVARGFPLGGIGAGGFGFNADGSFGELRFNNNWMRPIRGVRGCFHALFTRAGGVARMVVLRRTHPGLREYEGVANVRSTTFVGLLPGFTLRYADDLPVGVTLTGFTPHVPHDLRDSTLPAALFRFTLTNEGAAPVETAVLFAFENGLGRGGSGNLGLVLGPEHEVRSMVQAVAYDSIAGNFQEEAIVGARRGIRFRTAQQYPEGSHRRSVLGEYLLLADTAPGVSVTTCDGFDADAARPHLLDEFAADGRIRSTGGGRRGEDGGYRPAGAVAAAVTVPARATRELDFAFVWWTADHVTDPDLGREDRPGPARGTRVGHVYERHFPGPDAVATHVLDERARLAVASSEVPGLLGASSLPPWLVHGIGNSIDATLCNTVVPESGRLYTLEGMDWHWPMGGLTGTNDQRLSSHPYTAVFFPDLDASELDEFRRLADERGAIPHGNGNCDIALGSTDVPYGWPMYVKDWLPAKEWTDLTMSLVLQVGKLWRTTGRRALLDRFWPALVRGMEYLAGLAPHDVPEGGTTYDLWDFPGAFIYSATLYVATLRTMADLAATADPALVARYHQRHVRCARRIDRDLWNPPGYFQAGERQDTLFVAALAGDWIARYAGLPPVVDPPRAACHLGHAHRVLVTEALRTAAPGTRPLPRSEARFDGSLAKIPMAERFPQGEITYLWQVLSYHAMEQIYLGQVAEGLDTMRMIYDRVWHDGNAWSAGLRGSDESVYMTHPVAWATLNALTGAALDVPGRTLHLSPRTGGEIARLRCPVFFPPFWAMVEYDPARDHADFEVLRTFGEPVVIERVVERRADGTERIRQLARMALTEGQHLRLDLG